MKTYVVLNLAFVMERFRCSIDWKPGKNVTEKKIKEKQNGHKSGKKFVTKTIRIDSFFNFFSPPSGIVIVCL